MASSFTVLAFAWALAAYALYLIVNTFLSSSRHARLAQELKCEEPAYQKNRYVFGIDQIMRSALANKEKQLPPDMIQRQIDVGATTYRYSVFGATNVMTSDEKNIQAILATQFADFDLGPIRRGNFFPLLGNGIFTQDGKAWEHSRAMMRPQFARDQISDLDLEERHVQNMMRALETSLQSDRWTGEIDLQPLFFRLTLDSATEFLFGHSVDSQTALISGSAATNQDQPAAAFAKAFDESQQALGTRARFGAMHWLYSPKEFRESCKICHQFIDQFVQRALKREFHVKEMENGELKSKEKYVFLEALAAHTQDPIELRSQLLHILLAGRDTTASLLGWLFYCLSRDPVRFKKLREAIINEFGTYENPSEITFSKLKSCQYLQHCNNETLRLFPVVPLNSRFANKDTTIPRGGGKDGTSPVFISKGTMVDYSVYVMQRRKDIWGPDAEEWIPERFQKRRPGWEFLPFNGGPRVCIGQQFALTEASYVTVRLLQRFDKMENMDRNPVAGHHIGLTNCSATGVTVKLHSET